MSSQRRSRPISRILSRTIIPLGRRLLADSSDLPGGLGRAVLITPPYLVLLRAGFCLPPTLPPARCALTAPFHPYPSTRPFGLAQGGIFSVPLSVKLPCPGVTRRAALWSSDFPPASAVGAGPTSLAARHPRARAKTGDRLADCDTFIIDAGGRNSTPRPSIYPSMSCRMPYCSSFL